MQEEIKKILKETDKALSIYEINDLLKLKTASELKELLKTLNKMEDSLEIYRSKKDKYLLFTNCHLKVGTLIANKKGFGFVDIEGDEDVYISLSNMNGAIHGDKVIVEITSPKGIDLEGRIVKIVDRKLKQLVGEVKYKNRKPYLILDDDKIKLNIILPKNNNLMEGHKVLVKLTNKIKENTYNCEVLKIIGHKNDPGVDILSITYQMGIKDIFDEETLKETEKIPSEVSPNELVNRIDLRDKQIFTIDGDDTKDIDDAISLDILDNGNYKLGVHIADVSYYVLNNSHLDKEARERGTSVYLADRVIPMLPHKLSNGICSLNPGVDRLTISCMMEIDNRGNVVDYDIFPSVIRSKKQMTYKNVNEILEKNNILSGYEEFYETLIKMQELAIILRKNKTNRGYIDFGINEPKIIVNNSGKAIDVVLRDRGKGENLIEDFMIVANETVATHIYFMDLPFIYRVHGEPSEEKIKNFLRFISILGYKINGKIDKITPKTMQDLLKQLKEKKQFSLLSGLLLRSMQKAVYSEKNIGHFGIASKCYTHFTSPIRRYPDTIVHRLLHTYLFEQKLDSDTIDYWTKELPFIALETSNAERLAIECEREVDDMKMAEYMQDHIGEVYDGIVSSVMNFGMFVELPNLIEGLVKVDSLNDDYYTYDETTFALIGKKNKRGYRLGDSVKVKVVGADKNKKTIDFEVLNGNN